MRLLLAVVAALWVAVSVAEVPNPAFVPEAGFWWNEDETGRGYAIEVQDRRLFIAAYVYEDTGPGEPVWFTAGGATNAQFDFVADLKIAEGGQCFGCVYTQPTSTDTGMDVRIEFEDSTTATLFVDNNVIPIKRFWYAPTISGLLEALLGQWQIVVDYSDLDDGLFPFDADILVFDGFITRDGVEQADGFQPVTGREAAGSYNDDEQLYILVVGTQELDRFQAYYFFEESLGTDRFRGFAEQFQRGAELTGFGFPAQGFRTAGAQFVQETAFPIGKSGAAKKGAPVRSWSRTTGKSVLKSEQQLADLNATVRRLVAQIDQKRATADAGSD